MRKRYHHVALAALVAAALVSCASVPPRKPLTVELFDSTAAAPAKPAADPVLPMPAALAGPENQQGTSAAAPASLELSMAAPSDSASLVSLAAPSRPGSPSGFVLAQPVAPLLFSPVSRSVPASSPQPKSAAVTPVPAVQKAGPAQPAAAPQKTAQQQGAAPSATAQPAPAQPAAAQPSVSPSPSVSSAQIPQIGAAPGESYGRLREVTVRVADKMQFGLDGSSFLFLGFPDAVARTAGMSFISKEIKDGQTWFMFQALKLGTYDLDFLQQDNSTGTSTKETVRVHVVSDQDFNAVMSQQPAAGGSPAEVGDPAFAARLAGVGANEAAVAELLKGYVDGNPALNDQVAGLYMRMGSYDAAAKYYQKNLSLSSVPYANAAVLGLIRVAASQKDQVGLLAQLKKFLSIRDPAAEEPLIIALRMERDQAQVGVGLDLAAEYLSRYPAGMWRDEAAFIAAQFLEADSPFRDIARARELYKQIVALDPTSDFAAASQVRLQYIERHFFQVR